MAARFLTLVNPHRRRSRRKLYGAAARAHARRIGRVHRRRTRRNPPVATRPRRRTSRPSPPKMTPAMRAKISRAVKAANRRRASTGKLTLFRRRPLYGAALAASRRSRRRTGGGGGGFSAGSMMGAFKSALSKDLLMKAGGAVAASLGTGLLLNRYGASLPMANNKWGRVAYSVGIPILGAYLIRRKSRPLAEGMVIGGLVMGINAIITQARASTVSSYAPPTMVEDMGVAGELSFYPSASRANVGTPMTTAFSPSAW